MDFGKATTDDRQLLTEAHFLLPRTSQAALSGQPALRQKTYIGLPKWGRKEWAGEGNLYPPKTKEKEFLDQYLRHFNSIELNATHYKIHPKEHIEKWAVKAGERDFLFCPKLYQGITHRGSLNGKTHLTAAFFESVAGFGKHLGPVLIQVSDNYSTKRMDELMGYLASLPPGYEYFLEVRHPSWFEDTKAFDTLAGRLSSLKTGLVITDTVNRRDVIHLTLTVPKVMIRFGWFGVEPIDAFRIRQWKAVLDQWYASGLENCFFFLHVSDENETPGFAAFVQGVLG